MHWLWASPIDTDPASWIQKMMFTISLTTCTAASAGPFLRYLVAQWYKRKGVKR